MVWPISRSRLSRLVPVPSGNCRSMNDQVVVIGLDIFQAVGGGVDAVHRIAFRLQAALQDVAELLFVFDDQDAHV